MKIMNDECELRYSLSERPGGTPTHPKNLRTSSTWDINSASVKKATMSNCLALVNRQDHHLASPWWQAGMHAGAKGEELGSTNSSTNSSTMSKKREKTAKVFGRPGRKPTGEQHPAKHL